MSVRAPASDGSKAKPPSSALMPPDRERWMATPSLSHAEAGSSRGSPHATASAAPGTVDLIGQRPNRPCRSLELTDGGRSPCPASSEPAFGRSGRTGAGVLGSLRQKARGQAGGIARGREAHSRRSRTVKLFRVAPRPILSPVAFALQKRALLLFDPESVPPPKAGAAAALGEACRVGGVAPSSGRESPL